MGPISGRFACTALLLCLVTACGSDRPFAGSTSEVNYADRVSAVALEDAVGQGLVEVITRDHNCTRTEMGLVLRPTGGSQIWIRIDVGLQVHDPHKEDQVYITTQTKYVRLARRTNLLVTIPHVQRTMFRSLGIPSGARLSRCNDERLMKFLHAISKRSVVPDWKDVQIATWALTDNIPFDRVRTPPADGKIRLSVHPTINAREMLRIFALLEQVGYEKKDFALWIGALDEVDRLVDAYERLVDQEDRGAINPFRMICDLYPLESAADVLVSSFDRHQSDKGIPYRRYAFEVLRKIGGPSEIKIIKRVSMLESDRGLFEMMVEAAEASAAPVK
ncbi:MAG: hypothetical protein VX951_06500 [Planctomycetota bacterium]|nr:hypothetical protein [Planctomycetota bacterium]